MMSETSGVTTATANASTSGDAVIEAVTNVIVDCIEEFAEVDRDRIERGALLEVLDIDSLDLVEIGQVLEERFGVLIEPSHMKDVTTVGDAIDAVMSCFPDEQDS
jgi:acyl carrier protein